MLAAVSTVLMAVFTNLLATALTAAAIAYYDLVYTLWLKRTTAAEHLLGRGLRRRPGADRLGRGDRRAGPAAWVLFAVVFFWQLPHFYALAIKFKDDYARAGIPMLPVVASLRRVGLEIVLYTWLTVARLAGALAVRDEPDLRRDRAGGRGRSSWSRRTGCAGGSARGEPVKPMRLFHWSTTYLTILFVAVAIDALSDRRPDSPRDRPLAGHGFIRDFGARFRRDPSRTSLGCPTRPIRPAIPG